MDLTDHQRRVIDLFVCHGNQAEVARQLGVSRQAINQLLHRPAVEAELLRRQEARAA